MHYINLKRVAEPYKLIAGKGIGFLYILPAWVFPDLAIRPPLAQNRPIRPF